MNVRRALLYPVIEAKLVQYNEVISTQTEEWCRSTDSPHEITSLVGNTTVNYQHTGDAKKNNIHKDYSIFSYPTTNIIIDKEGR